MFVRAKKSGAYEYLQIVENQRVDGHVRQRVIATLGRLDVLQATGQIDALLSSGARFAERVSVLDAHKHGRLPPAERSVRRRFLDVFGNKRGSRRSLRNCSQIANTNLTWSERFS